jgi:YidC/Oxa1 family membrane protein insertase
MKMEKRALLAFVVSILLFLAYDALYLSPRVEKQKQRRAAEQELQRQLGTDTLSQDLAETGTRSSSPQSGQKLAEGGETRRDESPPTFSESTPVAETTADQFAAAGLEAAEFTIVSPLYEITLSTAGAEIVTVRLLLFETMGRPVELIAEDNEWTYARWMNASLEGQTASVSLGGVSFAAYRGGVGAPILDGSTITLDESRGVTEIVFRADRNGNGAIERYYRFYPDRYSFDAGIRFPSASFPDVTGVSWGMGPGLRGTEKNVKDDQQNFKAAVKLGEEIHRLKPGNFGDKSKEEFSGTLSWASLQTKYFTAALIPPEPTRAAVTISGNKKDHRISQRLVVPAVVRQGSVDNSLRVYMGPLDYKMLGALDVGLEKNIEMGWKLIRPVSWVVLKALLWTYHVIPNYGLVIIIISILTKVLFFRLTHKSFKSMKDMQALQPRIQALKEKHGDDRQKVSQETMKLYKEAGVNPLGGCLPMLLQMPVFIALFSVLRGTIELRGAPFFGWITDLSQQDVLFTLPLSLPLIGDAFSLLPLLMGASMFVQTKIGGSFTGTPGAQTTPAGFNTMMPIVFTFLFYKMPSGLVVYWIVNTVLSVAQQYYINKQPHEPKGSSPDEPAKPTKPNKEPAKRPPTAKKRRSKTKGR